MGVVKECGISVPGNIQNSAGQPALFGPALNSRLEWRPSEVPDKPSYSMVLDADHHLSFLEISDGRMTPESQ